VHPADTDAVVRLAFASLSTSPANSQIGPSPSFALISTHRNRHHPPPPPPWRHARPFRILSHRDDSSRMSTETKIGQNSSSSEQQPQQLHLLTFDLDDTLFPIQPVLDDANEAMVRAMHRLGYSDVTNEDVVSASKLIRRELREVQSGGGVMTYTELRKTSIRRVLECYFLTGSCSSSSSSSLQRQSQRRLRLEPLQQESLLQNNAESSTAAALGKNTIHDSVVDHVFDTWLSERHASADRNLFSSAIEMLKQIRTMRTTHHPYISLQNGMYNNRNDDDYDFKASAGIGAATKGKVVIGAITNGRGNPFDMPSISPYFDFCISGEDEGVFPKRKPDRGIYEAALRRYRDLVLVETKNGSVGDSALREEEDNDIVLNWVHVGDDLANDVGASASCGAKAVWLIEESLEDETGEVVPSWSTATNEELEKRAKLDEMARQYVSAKIDKLDELPSVIMGILEG